MGGGGASAPPPPVLVIGGFLGSGKTSLILDFARWFTASGGRLGILVNEAGTVGIDGSVLTAPGHQVREVFGGCVCCSLAGDLELGVRALAAYDIDLVVLEPSGMAELDRIAALLEDHAGSAVVVAAVIDAPRLELLRRVAGRLLDSSVRAARFVLLNKVDAAEESASSEARAWVRRLRPEADLLEVSAELGVDPSVWEVLAETVVPGWLGAAPAAAHGDFTGGDGVHSSAGVSLGHTGPSPDAPTASRTRDGVDVVAQVSVRLVLEDLGDSESLPRVLELLLENAVTCLGEGAAGHAKALARWQGGGFYASTTTAGAPVVVRQLISDDRQDDSTGTQPVSGEILVDLVLLFAGRTEVELTGAMEAGLSAVRSDPVAGPALLRVEAGSECSAEPG